jgi:hypothetical protein
VIAVTAAAVLILADIAVLSVLTSGPGGRHHAQGRSAR